MLPVDERVCEEEPARAGGGGMRPFGKFSPAGISKPVPGVVTGDWREAFAKREVAPIVGLSIGRS